MLVIFVFLLLFVMKSAKSSKQPWISSVSYTAFLYVSSVLYFFHQQKLSWTLGNFFLPITDFPKSTVIVLVSALIICGMVGGFLYLVKKEKLTKKYSLVKKDWLWFSGTILLIFGGALAFTSSRWAMNGIGNMRFDQIVFALTQPLKGSDPGQIQAFILQPFLEAVLFSIPILTVIYLISTYSLIKQKVQNYPKRRVLSLGFVGLFIGIFLSAKVIGYADIKAYYFESTEIYEQHYVDPKEVQLTFPKEKRNLIYIFMESMESSYLSTEYGGSQSQNLLPNLTTLAENQGIHFSHNGQIGGGMLQSPGANQTASSMVAQTSGLPLRPATSFGLTDGSGANSAEYFPGAYSLGEILSEQGYNQILLMGSKAEFAGRDQYFQQHGNYEIRDYNWAIENGKIPEDYYVWWGYEDDKLFDFAKETLGELASEDEPFNLTMLTADTHFEDGYATEETPNLFDDQYSNVIHASDQQIMDFLTWVQEQPFYEDTTIILSGDHLTMDSDFFLELDPEYQRSIYNVFLNTNQSSSVETTRQFSAMDMFPTTLSALDVKISGNRLGLGTNLFSSEATLVEQLGYENFESELMKGSEFYEEKLMYTEETTASE